MNAIFKLKVLLLVIVFLISGWNTEARLAGGETFGSTAMTVGRTATNDFETPTNQRLTPAGKLVEFPGMRPQAIALSPDQRLLVTSGKSHDLIVMDAGTGAVLQTVALPKDSKKKQVTKVVSDQILDADTSAELSFTGLTFSPDGSRIYLANVTGDIKVFSVERGVVKAIKSFLLPKANAPRRDMAIPAGIVVSPDGKRLYVALNLSNRLLEMDAETGKELRMWDVGVEPYDVALLGNKVWVSNWGGRRPETNSVTGPAGRGMLVRVDTTHYVAAEGTVSIIDLDGKAATKEIQTGIHACGMALTPDHKHLAVANAGSDTISILDVATDQIVETICARVNPGDLFGAQPNAVAFDKSGKFLFAANGTQNAIAVFDFQAGESKWKGLIPVGWFPAALVFDQRHHSIDCASIKGLSTGRTNATTGKPEYNSREWHGSVSIVPVPSTRQLGTMTEKSLANIRYPLLAAAKLAPRAGIAAHAVPERVGEPSLIKHVIYIIKENRTYDQVLGDVKEGNGEPSLCIFGEHVSPNQHALVHQFALLDNTYCCGSQSCDGHQWADSGIATDYMEKSFAGFPRSYPAGGGKESEDAMAYSPAGFIWDDAVAHGVSLRDFGEFTGSYKKWKETGHKKGKPSFTDIYENLVQGTDKVEIWSEPNIESIRPFMETNTVGFDLGVPDVFRAAQFKKALNRYEAEGKLPQLIIMWISNDHTSGTKEGTPTPAARVADNDLGVGQIVDALSHSSFWKDSCVFAIEDDPQAGWDHVSGYRTTAYVVGPYVKHAQVIHTQYNHTSLLRTMELILGLPPMNQLDATATPMFDCFTDQADLATFTALSNNVPLLQMNPSPKSVSNPVLRKDAYVSGRLPFDKEDQCPDDVLNRILWHAMKGSDAPYPTWAVKVADDD